MIEERSLTSYLIIWKTTKIIKGGNIMSKSNSFKKSRKLALGIAVAMGWLWHLLMVQLLRRAV